MTEPGFTANKETTIMAKQYKIAAGDTVWDISKKQLGSYARYAEIVRINKLKTATLKEGMVLKLPEI